jgi:predicted regulator of Ras-like GTPase activity (Roadblock/LC7/MglB family)
MNFPAGTESGIISTPRDEGFIRDLKAFVGAIEIETGTGHGFILTENGNLISAYFQSEVGAFRGREALSHMTLGSGGNDDQIFSLRRYDAGEFSLALRISRDEHLLLTGTETASAIEARPVPQPGGPVVGPADARKVSPSVPVPAEYIDETRLRKILCQPGVIAVSAFFEGFPVRSIGDADFEHVAASAEDFMRAGMKIATEMKTGDLDQLILETAKNKFIIAPCGDLYLCIFTTSEAPLGLIRVVLKSIQKEIAR